MGDLRGAIERETAAIAVLLSMDDTILQAIKVREEWRGAIRQELKVFALQRPGEPDAKEIRATLAGYLADWTAMTERGVVEAVVARSIGRPNCVSAGPATARLATGQGPRPESAARLRARRRGIALQTFCGVISVSLMVAPTGFEPVFQP